MKIAIIDPALFDMRDDGDIIRDVDFVLRSCKLHNILLPPVVDYWGDLWREKVSLVKKAGSVKLRQAIRELEKLSEQSSLSLTLETPAGAVWKNGFEDMFGETHTSLWPSRMAAAIIRVSQCISAADKVYIFTRKIFGRNVMLHSAGDSNLEEITRWMVHVQPQKVGPRQILCVYHQRNFSEPWTVRFDWRLPCVADGGRYPFFYPERWWKGSTEVFATVRSKPCWVDEIGNGWARPNIQGGRGYHWDVYIKELKLVERIGVDQLNIKEYGSSSSEGEPGEIHHIPADKKSKIKDVGWRK